MSAFIRTMRRYAHENPVYFYSILIGAAGPVMVAVVPPVRRNWFGYVPAEGVPSSYPLPRRERVAVSSEFDDPK